MKSFKNKRVWITGASDGIGKELAIQLANAGAKIILTARSTEKLEAIKND
ncbi:MAG: SDR family NAD(P)-dependent oxidoreductase, partial [Bacteroidota bacterium]